MWHDEVKGEIENRKGEINFDPTLRSESRSNIFVVILSAA